MSKKTVPHFVLSTSLLIGAAAVGACGQTIDPAPGFFGHGDTSGGELYDPGLLEPGECVFTEAQDGVQGYKHQCNGTFLARIGGEHMGLLGIADPEPFSYLVPKNNFTSFGVSQEPYEQAKVMACCGEYDSEQEEEFWPTYAENCMLDFRQQACRSIAAALETYINDGTVPGVFKEKATDVQNWLAERTTECMNELAAGDTSPYPDIMVDAIWQLPDDKAPWAPQLQNVYVEIIFGFITSVDLPTSPEMCTSLHDNDEEVFTDQSGTPLNYTFYVELDEAEGGLLGPLYNGARIHSTADFASLATSCSAPYCSTASFSVGDRYDFAIDSMVLYVDGPVIATNGTDSVTITSARIELYQQAHGFVTCGTSCNYTIPAGDAHFIVVGKSGGEVVTLALPNSSNITAHFTVNSGPLGNSWSLDPFEIEYVDDSSETWTLSVNSSEWL